jgi:hypothetical protein
LLLNEKGWCAREADEATVDRAVFLVQQVVGDIFEPRGFVLYFPLRVATISTLWDSTANGILLLSHFNFVFFVCMFS